MAVRVCKQDPPPRPDTEKEQMYISLLFIMKVRTKDGGGSRFFIVIHVSDCKGRFS